MNSKNASIKEKLKQIKSKNSLENIKSTFIFKKIFEYTEKNKSLEIMRYNKRLQKRLNLSIDDYKEYSQLYTPIEIELKIVDNKYGDFINISNEEKKYYHIYFDNSNKEIKRNYLEENEEVKMIKIIIDYQVKSFKELFVFTQLISKNFIEII